MMRVTGGLLGFSGAILCIRVACGEASADDAVIECGSCTARHQSVAKMRANHAQLAAQIRKPQHPDPDMTDFSKDVEP